MSERIINIGSWFALALALAALAGAGYFGWQISKDKLARAEALQSAQESATRREAAARVHALAVDTQAQRERLKGFLDVDVLSAVEVIEAAARAAKVKMEVGSAQSENAPSGSDSVKAVGFHVSAEGSFAALMRALQLFETLPLPSSVVRFELERASGSTGAPWRMNAYIRVLTTAPVSS